MSLTLLLRLAGASLIVLSLFHAVLWRALNWGSEIDRLSQLTARVFAVHTFFIAFVLFALGALSLVRPDLLLTSSELALLLLSGVVLFWIARLALQPLVFHRAMSDGWVRARSVRYGASLLFLSYVAIYGAALWRQLR